MDHPRVPLDPVQGGELSLHTVSFRIVTELQPKTGLVPASASEAMVIVPAALD